MTSPFADLGLAPPILKALQELGYEQPSPIQEQSIPLLLAGHNLLGVAQTGTGKTAAFALPLLSKLESQPKPQVLVLTPTRELAIQVAEAFQSYSRHLPDFHVLPVYGGQEMGGQLRALKRRVQVVVGTPGRIMDHLRRGSLQLGDVRAVVLDEADEMLRMGFIDDVETILAETPDTAQRALFSATMPSAIQRIVGKYLGDAKEVKIAAKTRTVERIQQRYMLLTADRKLEALTRILEVENFDGMLIFVRTKSSTVTLSEKLEARGFAAGALNGDLNQQLRERTVNRLKNGQLDIVVATDVAARGLDVDRISHVINYDIPYDSEAYVHRIGRTGRAGREGNAILFVTHKERRLLRAIEQSTRQAITPMSLPTGEEVGNQRLAQFSQRLEQALTETPLDKFKTLVAELADKHGWEPLDMAAALIYQQQKERPLFPEFKDKPMDRFEAAPEGKKQKRKKDERPAKKNSAGKSKPGEDSDNIAMETYRLEVGHDHGVQPGDIVGAIANEADLESRYIGRIKIADDHSTVDLPEGMPKPLLLRLRKMRIRQQPSRMQLAANATAPAGGYRDTEGKSKKPQDKGFKDKRPGAKPPTKGFKAKGAARPRKRVERS